MKRGQIPFLAPVRSGECLEKGSDPYFVTTAGAGASFTTSWKTSGRA